VPVKLDDFQKRALETDQNPGTAETLVPGMPLEPTRAEVIALLGMVGEVGGLLSEYKKLLRDGETHRKFRDEVAEELGDILWYVANVASKYDLSLGDVATANLAKTEGRWKDRERSSALYDDDQAPNAQLPRLFEYSFEHRDINGIERLVLVDRLSRDGDLVGDPLTDNAYDDDGYRYHDVFHLTLAALFGWSPVHRKLLRKRDVEPLANREPSAKADAEDGGRAQVIDEAIALTAYGYAADHDLYAGTKAVDWQLLRHIKRMTDGVEVKNRTTKEWNDAILRAFAIWRELRDHRGGVVRGDLRKGEITFTPPG
jgi:NTP pyrophosphatase (non-canonical NTP hydrolase)